MTAGTIPVPVTLPEVSDPALVLWILLVRAAGLGPTCQPTLVQIQRLLGRRWGTDPGNVTRLCRELARAGLLTVDLRYDYGTGRFDPQTHNVYTPFLRDRCPVVDLPAAILGDLGAGRVQPCLVAALYRWMRVCRLDERWTREAGGWTVLGVAEAAEDWGQTVRTVRSHRSLLARLGYLDRFDRPGRRSFTAPAGQLPNDIPEALDRELVREAVS